MEGLLAAAGMGDLEAVPGEDRGQRGGDVVVVLDEQQSHGAPSSVGPWRTAWPPCIHADADSHVKRVPVLRVFRYAPGTRKKRRARERIAVAHGAYPGEAGSLCSILPQM
ncbi:hypothetical protein GCM10010347_47550 [Streptomyces cirratus]|uniref:Transposase n=1 Tax=Streptomyces cirratus TaxID=68187 RepID=A0ABQ3EXJ9_9ACTN|nr:hypothetical protein GCM10010347_47550 [Streptomyces cirratus]